MTPGARLAATIELTDKIWTGRVPMDKQAADYFRPRRHVGAKDRAEVAERTYSLMRHNARLDWWCTRLNVQGVRARTLLHSVLVEGASLKRVSDLFSGRGYDPEPLTDEERTWLATIEGQTINHPDMPEIVRLECPAHAEGFLRERFGDDFAAKMEEMLTPAPLDLRVNTVLTTKAIAKASLAKDGIETEDMKISPWGLRVLGKVYLASSKAFAKGWVEIQDEGSQVIAMVCDALPGQQVMDYCAGGGGKTLALAAAMNNKGRVVAMDTSEDRLEKGKPRFRKAGIHNIEVRPLSDEKQRTWFKRQKENFDCVLVDAPCSSSGTWRRNPDLRWRPYGPSLDELLATQAEILDRVVKTVKPGGKLVYATCSLNRAENEDQVAAFLERHPQFKLAESRAHNGFFVARIIKEV